MNAPLATDLRTQAEMTVHTLISAVDGLERTARLHPAAITATAWYIADARDRLNVLLERAKS